MNVGTLTISLTARTASLAKAAGHVKAFESGIVASVQRTNAAISSVGMAFSALTIPIAAIGIGSTKMFAEFEFSLARVEGLVGIARDQTRQWGAEILELSKRVGRSANEMGEALYFVTSAGIRGANTMKVVEISAQAAAAGMGEAKEIADLLTSAINAYGEANLSVTDAMDSLVTAVREGKVEASDLILSMGKVLPISSAMGASFNEVGAAIAGLTRTGTPARTAGMMVRRMLLGIQKPAEGATKVLKSMGGSFEELRDIVANEEGGLLKALLELKRLTDIFGEEKLALVFPNLRAYLPALDLLGANLEKNKTIWEAMLEPAGNFKLLMESTANTFQYKFAVATNAAGEALIQLGHTFAQNLIPIINEFREKVIQFSEWWTGLSRSTQNLIIKITLLTGVIGPLLILFSSLIGIVLSVASAIGKVVAGLWAIATNPVTLAILGIIAALFALNTAAWALVQTWDKTWMSFQVGWNNVLLKALEVVNWFQNFDWSEMFKNLKESFKQFFKDVLQWFEDFFTDLDSKIENGIKKLNQSKLGKWVHSIGTWGLPDEGMIVAPEVKIKEPKFDDPILSKTEQTMRDIKKANEEFARQMEGKEGFGEAFVRNANIQFESITKGLKTGWSGIKDTLDSLIKDAFGEGPAAGSFPAVGKVGKGFDFPEYDSLYATMFGDNAFLKGPETEGMGLLTPTKTQIWQVETFREELELLAQTAQNYGDGALLIGDSSIRMGKEINEVDEIVEDTYASLATMEMNAINLGMAEADAADKASYLSSQLKKILDMGRIPPESLESVKALKEHLDELAESSEDVEKRIEDSFTRMYGVTSRLLGSLGMLLSDFGNILGDTFTEAVKPIIDFIRVMESIFRVIDNLVKISAIFEKEKEKETAMYVANTVSKSINTAATKANTKAKIANGVASGQNATVTGVEAAATSSDAVAKVADTAATNVNTVAKDANAASKIGSAIASTIEWLVSNLGPIFGVAIAIGMVAGIISMFSSGKKKASSASQMADGGIVPSGYPNDSYPALLTSGEMVVPPGKLPNFSKEFNQGQSVAMPNGEWVIRGKDLVYIVDEYRRRSGNTYR